MNLITTLLTIVYRLVIVSWITAKRQIIHNTTVQRSSWNNTYDFIVVGAGAAGCAVAHRLAESGRATVLLLEAGGAQNAIWTDIPSQFTVIGSNNALLWRYYNEPQTNAGHQYPLGRAPDTFGEVIGGSTSVSTLVYARGNRRDYDEWQTKYGAQGWSFADVLPFFRKFENNTDPHIVAMSPGYHSTSGPVQISSPKNPAPILFNFLNIFNRIGFPTIDMNGPKQTGTMISQAFTGSNGLRSSTGTAYVDPNPFPQNLHIVSNALVYKILFNGLTAVGVEFSRNDSPFRVFAAKEVIVSAGAINTPQLLMLSGVGPRSHLESFGIKVIKDLPVGDHYKSHTDILIGTFNTIPLSVNNLEQLYFNRNGPLSEVPFLSLYISTQNNRDKEWPNVKINLVANPYNSSIQFIELELLKIRSEGCVRLQSVSPYISPMITTNFLLDPHDFEARVEGTKFMLYLMQLPEVSQYMPSYSFEGVGCQSCPGVKDYLCDSGIECFVRQSIFVLPHPAGSCRMGAVQRPDVVVDPSLRVKGMRNLRVCDASIFPDLPNANPQAAANMVGEKCAQLIKQANM